MHDTDTTRERFEELFRVSKSAVRAFARRRVPADQVDDVVSETFLVAWRRLDQIPADPLPWLLTVARNVIGTERRGESRRLRLWMKAQSGYVEGHDPHYAATEDGRVLDALAQLSERDREALTLVAWDGLTPAEAARVLGVPAARFRVRLHRAGRRLRAMLVAESPTEVPASDPIPPAVSSRGATA